MTDDNECKNKLWRDVYVAAVYSGHNHPMDEANQAIAGYNQLLATHKAGAADPSHPLRPGSRAAPTREQVTEGTTLEEDTKTLFELASKLGIKNFRMFTASYTSEGSIWYSVGWTGHHQGVQYGQDIPTHLSLPTREHTHTLVRKALVMLLSCPLMST